VFALHFTADRDGDEVTFLHRVAEGTSSSSYGVEVARLAGVPDRVVERARTLVEAAETETEPEARTESETETETGTGTSDGAATRRPTTAEVDRGAATNGDGLSGKADGEGAERAFRQSHQGGGGRAKSAPLPDPSREPGDDMNHVVDEVLRDVRAVDVARTTPMDALALLHELQRRLDDASRETR
jgi:DNA mismatch repair protein MutS